jgi:hypothetical protein
MEAVPLKYLYSNSWFIINELLGYKEVLCGPSAYITDETAATLSENGTFFE